MSFTAPRRFAKRELCQADVKGEFLFGWLFDPLLSAMHPILLIEATTVNILVVARVFTRNLTLRVGHMEAQLGARLLRFP